MNNTKLYPYQNLSLVDMEGEIWKAYKGLEEYLEVSNMGRIKLLFRTLYRKRNGNTFIKERIVKQFICKSRKTITTQLLNISINIEHITHRIRVSRAVYSTFVGALSKDYLVCHQDEDTFNNLPKNLYKMTYQELGCLNVKTGRSVVPDVSKFSEELWDKIRNIRNVVISQYDKEGNHIQTFHSYSEAERLTGINKTQISSVVNGKVRTAKGYIWKKGDNPDKLTPEELYPHLAPKRYSFERAVIQYQLDGTYLQTFMNTTQAASTLQIDRRTFSYRLSKAKGKLEEENYLWEYAKKGI